MSKEDSLEDILEGVLHLFSETGTEGGYWAFQDSRYISQTNPSFGVYARQDVWDSDDPKRKGKVQDNIEVLLEGEWHPLPDPIWGDPDFAESSLYRGERNGDREADKRLMERYGFSIKYAKDRMDEEHGEGNWYLEDPDTAVTADGTRWMYGGTPSTEPQRPYGVPPDGLTRATIEWEDGKREQRLSNTLLVTSWSYEGLHVLGDGDKLTIYHPESGDEVWSGTINLKQHNLFTEHASGYWIHADQNGIPRDKWAEYFFNGYRARLEPAKKR